MIEAFAPSSAAFGAFVAYEQDRVLKDLEAAREQYPDDYALAYSIFTIFNASKGECRTFDALRITKICAGIFSDFMYLNSVFQLLVDIERS